MFCILFSILLSHVPSSGSYRSSENSTFNLFVRRHQTSFMCLLAICIFSLKKYLFKFFAHLKKLGYWSFCCWVIGVFYVSWTLTLVNSLIHRYFLSSVFLSFHFLVNILWCSKFIILMRSSWFFFFCCLCFWCYFKNPLPNPVVGVSFTLCIWKSSCSDTTCWRYCWFPLEWTWHTCWNQFAIDI